MERGKGLQESNTNEKQNRRDLLRIAQGLVGLANILEPFRRRLVIRILVRVVHDRQSTVRLFDVSLGRVPRYAQYLIVVLSLALLQLQLRVSDLSLDARLARVRLVYGLVFAQRGLPVALFGKRFRLGFAGFDVGRVEVQSSLAIGNGRLRLL
jgi:hypothetical protein